MNKLKYSSRLQGAAPRIRQKNDSLKTIDTAKDSSIHLRINEMLSLVCPILEMMDFVVETDKNNQSVNSYLNSDKRQIANDNRTVKINARVHYVTN